MHAQGGSRATALRSLFAADLLSLLDLPQYERVLLSTLNLTTATSGLANGPSRRPPSTIDHDGRAERRPRRQLTSDMGRVRL
jgi:hypothetical protein